MLNLSFASSSEDSTSTPVFEDTNLICQLCSRSLISVVTPVRSTNLYEISQMCYTVCSKDKFSVCGQCIMRKADEKILELRSVLDNEHVFNTELRSYRTFQANHACARSVSIKMYTRDASLDKFSFDLYMKTLPDCEECQNRESILDLIRGSWSGFCLIQRSYIEKQIRSLEKTKRNFKWCGSIHKLHQMYCPCKRYTRYTGFE